MKILSLITWMLLSAVSGGTPEATQLPELHTIKTVTLSPSYSCRSREEFRQKGYDNTALFLSGYSKRRNSPDLLFNGACGSPDYFGASTAGDDMALISALGAELPLERVTAHNTFANRVSLPGAGIQSEFQNHVRVVPGHTYAVLLNKSEIRGLFIFTVTEHIPNKSVTLRYAVKQYQIQRTEAESPGFDWGKTNTQQ